MCWRNGWRCARTLVGRARRLGEVLLQSRENDFSALQNCKRRAHLAVALGACARVKTHTAQAQGELTSNRWHMLLRLQGGGGVASRVCRLCRHAFCHGLLLLLLLQVERCKGRVSCASSWG